MKAKETRRSGRRFKRIAGRLVVFLVLGAIVSVGVAIGASAGWKCSMNRLSNPGWETDLSIALVFVLSLSLIGLHARHWRRRAGEPLLLGAEIVALWVAFASSYDIAQRIAGAGFYQNLIGLSIVGSLVSYLVVFAALAVVVRVRADTAQGVCPACGYDLRGTAHEKCPECGRAVEVEGEIEQGGEPPR